MKQILTQRRFTLADQVAFAQLSGDYNPIHIDPIAARRYMFGEPVVHGLHTLLWALDSWLASGLTPVRLQTVEASFMRPVGLEQAARLALIEERAGRREWEISIAGSVAAKLCVTFEPELLGAEPAASIHDSFPPRVDPYARTADELEGLHSTLALHLERQAATRLFPNATRCLSAKQVAILLATTRLVGAHCPGLHSLYASLDLELFAGEGNADTELEFTVERVDRRIGLVRLRVSAAGVSGLIKAFLRPAPVEQPSYAELTSRIEPGEFSGQHALVIGGSRGLGEVTAKLLAAGGAVVMITYHRGQDDAARIVNEIRSKGGSANFAHFDVLKPDAELAGISTAAAVPTHCYYFASPFIFSGSKGVFSAELFDKFAAYYVAGFARTVDYWRKFGVKHYFYPSTIAIDELPVNMGEYAAAKSAGECLCTFLEKCDPGLMIYRPRLPRAATDQTVSLLSVENRDPVELMTGDLRRFRAQSTCRA